MFKLRWPLSRRPDAIWAQKNNPAVSAVAEGFRPIKVQGELWCGRAARSLPLCKSPDTSKALLVGEACPCRNPLN